MKVAFSFFISFLFTFYLVPFCVQIAKRFKILDLPDGRIKIHKSPTPYLGGIAIYIGFVLTLALILPFDGRLSLLILGSTILLIVGLIDDLIVVKPYQKLFGQIIAAFCYLKTAVYIKELFFLNHMVYLPLALFWIILVVNAFNLVDVMDGLATTIAIYGTLGFLLVSLLSANTAISVLLAALLGSLCAYFYYNKPVAKIYLGDAGSLFIGGSLAVIPFFISWGSYGPLGFLSPVVFLSIPIIEVIGLVIIRTYKGIPFYLGNPDHYCLYLKRKGWSVWMVLAFTSSFAIALTGVGIFNFYGIFSLSALCFAGILFAIFWLLAIFSPMFGLVARHKIS